MKRSQKISKGLALALAAASVLTVGCGGSKDNVQHSTIPVNPGYPNQPGYPGGTGACIPITQPIPFSAQNVYIDSANIQADAMQVRVGQAMAVPGNTYTNQYNPSPDAQISLQVSFGQQYPGGAQPQPYPNTYPSYGTGYLPNSRGSISGHLTLSQGKIQEILYKYGMGGGFGYTQPGYGYPQQPGYGYGYPNQPGYMPQQPGMQQVPCVRALQIDTGYGAPGGMPTVHSGWIYLHLNSTSMGGFGGGQPEPVML